MAAYTNQRWWYSQLLNAYTMILKQLVTWSKQEKTDKGERILDNFK